MVSSRESLLTPSAIKLYGRIIRGLRVDVADARDELGGNRFLREQLERPEGEPQPALARIYGYSYIGRYTPLSRPAIFLVHGKGFPASPRAPAVVQPERGKEAEFAIDPEPGTDGPEIDVGPPFRDPTTSARFSPGPVTVDVYGQALQCCEFSADIRVWEYDRGDFSMRLDVESGPLERILIEAEMSGDETMPYFRGNRVRIRGPQD